MLQNLDFEFQVLKTPFSLLNNRDLRMDANYYADETQKAKIIIEELKKNGVRIETIEDVSEKIYNRPRFKRKYTDKDNERGLPFLTPTDLFMFPFKPNKFIIDPPEGLRVSRNWILMTCSGTVGRSIISNRFHEKSILSHDIIRLKPMDDLLGYIYAYLNTWIGKVFLTRNQYGGVIKHIEPHHVEKIPIPIIEDNNKIRRINQLIIKSQKLREEALDLFEKAMELFYEKLGLPKISEKDIDYYGGDSGRKVRAFIISQRKLNFRLDASFHNPLKNKALEILKEIGSGKHGFLLKELTSPDVSKDIFTPPRFKRQYVVKDGVPLLQGIHLRMIKYLDIKLISKNMKNLEKYRIKENWVLISASGTIGNSLLVTPFINDWCATNHMIRIVPTNINPGYLIAFLHSEYGSIQMQSLGYGSVVSEIGEAGELLRHVKIILPDIKIQTEIGDLIIKAYSLKDEAINIEDQAIGLLEQLIFNSAN